MKNMGKAAVRTQYKLEVSAVMGMTDYFTSWEVENGKEM
jgi:hypothetical protein